VFCVNFRVMKYNRSTFLKQMAAGVAAGIVSKQAVAKPTNAAFKPVYGLASYTLRKYSLADVISICKQTGLTHVSLKSMHMPLDSTPAFIQAAAKQVRDAGLTLYGAGVIYMKTSDEVNQAFAYAQHAGLQMIIGVPNHELLPLVEEKVKATNIKIAIHNHGPNDLVYPSPRDVFDKIKDLDSRIGLCIDIGHVIRINEDPIEHIKKYKNRLYDLHMKDVTGRTGKDTPLEIGRGVIPIPAVMLALKKIKYSGVIAFEYEKEDKDTVPGLAESIGYVKGVAAAI
jgi:inosose dehydratase